MNLEKILIIINSLSLLIWIYLLLGRGKFWQATEKIPEDYPEISDLPPVSIIIPARNEAEVLPQTLPSILTQEYPEELLKIILVDDGSTDETASIATETASNLGKSHLLEIISTSDLPPKWSGKLWALEQGIRHSQTSTNPSYYYLLTDADIQHHRQNLRQLVSKAEIEDLEITSLMVLLKCQNFWEKLLIPAFVFFFQKLYPFPWVNNPQNSTAAAAGGCILIRREALEKIGGISRISQALIDDCALAEAVKSSSPLTRIWLGLTEKTKSLRDYPSLKSIWDMVARTAYTQLNYSPFLLVGVVVAMGLIYLVSPLSLLVGLLIGNRWISCLSFSVYLLMAFSFLPTLKFYNSSPLWSFFLPKIALLYTLMTIDSAFRHWQGKGGAWKGRVYK